MSDPLQYILAPIKYWVHGVLWRRVYQILLDCSAAAVVETFAASVHVWNLEACHNLLDSCFHIRVEHVVFEALGTA
jgi:hypothetical protein